MNLYHLQNGCTNESSFCTMMLFILIRCVDLFQDDLYLLSVALYTQELLLLDCSAPSGCLAASGSELSSLSNSNFQSIPVCKQ